MAFILPSNLVDAEERKQFEMVQERARDAVTPFLSFFSSSEIMALARGTEC